MKTPAIIDGQSLLNKRLLKKSKQCKHTCNFVHYYCIIKILDPTWNLNRNNKNKGSLHHSFPDGNQLCSVLFSCVPLGGCVSGTVWMKDGEWKPAPAGISSVCKAWGCRAAPGWAIQMFSQPLAGGVNAPHSRTWEGCWRTISNRNLYLLECIGNISVKLKL